MEQNRTIADILHELQKDYRAVLGRAVQQATKTASEDVYKFSMSVLERYYGNYAPSRYIRTDQLWRAAIPVAEVELAGDVIAGVFGVDYDGSVLDGAYYGSKKYGHPEGDWVLENYLLGIHPRTDGSSEPGGGNYDAEIWVDPVSPDASLKRYLRLYVRKFETNVIDYLIAHVAK